MAAIGRVRGWNTNLTFWVSAIFYTLLLIGLYVADVIANNAPDYSYDLTIRLLVLLVVVIMIGLLLPLGILALHRMYPDAFTKVAPSHTTSNSSAQIAQARSEHAAGSGNGEARDRVDG